MFATYVTRLASRREYIEVLDNLRSAPLTLSRHCEKFSTIYDFVIVLPSLPRVVYNLLLYQNRLFSSNSRPI